jgi:hypothetical protein
LIFSNLANRLGKLPGGRNLRLGLSEISLAIAGLVLMYFLHEQTHGLVMQMLGARPKYGIIWKGQMLYACAGYFLTCLFSDRHFAILSLSFLDKA